MNIKDNTSELNKNRMKSVLDIETDLEDENGTTGNILYTNIYILLVQLEI